MSDRLSSRVEQLLDSSKVVLDQCALPNGALVAANSDLEVYPSSAENYRFSWARDAAYQLLAANALAPTRARERTLQYTKWLSNVQGFTDTGLYLKRYGTNGALDVRYGEHFQPDQSGALIGAIDTIVPEDEPLIDAVIQKMADGLHDKWNGRDFSDTQDLWENRHTPQAGGEVFTYSLAATHHGLTVAAARLYDKVDIRSWQKTIKQMNRVFSSDPNPYFLRTLYTSRYHTQNADNTIDASLSGLAYPLHQSELMSKLAATTRQIHEQLFVEGQGVYRYQGDTYDGIVREGSQEATAGAWPLLTFWHAIALKRAGDESKARDVYFDTIERLDYEFTNGNLPNNSIPEQLYPDCERQGKGVLPLAWSHAKFVLATQALNLMETDNDFTAA